MGGGRFCWSSAAFTSSPWLTDQAWSTFPPTASANRQIPQYSQRGHPDRGKATANALQLMGVGALGSVRVTLGFSILDFGFFEDRFLEGRLLDERFHRNHVFCR